MNAKRPPPLFPLRHSKSLRFQLPGRSLNLMTISERDGSPSNMSPSNTSASQSSPRTPRSPRSVDDSGTATTAMLAAVGEDMELPGKIKPPPLVMFAPNSNLVLQRGETIDTTNDRLLRQALSRLFEPAEFTEITGLDMADYRLVYKLEDRFVASTSKFASLEDPPTPGVWVAKLLVIAIQRVANAALVFKSACEQLSNVCRRAVMLCTEAWLLHYHLCSDPMMRILKRLKEVYLFIKAFSQPSWMGFLFPPLSTTTVRQFVTLDTNLQAAFNGLMPVLPALTPDLKNLGMFRRYINDGEERALTLRYLSDVWEYDRESTRGIPTEMVVEVCRQLGNPHTMRSLEELKKAQVAALRM